MTIDFESELLLIYKKLKYADLTSGRLKTVCTQDGLGKLNTIFSQIFEPGYSAILKLWSRLSFRRA